LVGDARLVSAVRSASQRVDRFTNEHSGVSPQPA
jgi:hypothetical protein